MSDQDPLPPALWGHSGPTGVTKQRQGGVE